MKLEHQWMVKLEDKYWKMQYLLKHHMSSNEPQQTAFNRDIKELEKYRSEIAEIEVMKKQEEMNFKWQQKHMEKEKADLKHQLEVLQVKVKEKWQETRLNELKIKELKWQLPHGQLAPLKQDDIKWHETPSTTKKSLKI